jgi:ADP-heptose:LPS heptosyltransferase
VKILKTIHRARKAVTGRMTGHMSSTRISDGFDARANGRIERILIVRPNHRLGNQLLITPLLQDVSETFPHARIDLFVKGTVAAALFRNYKNIHRIIALPKRPLKNIPAYVAGWLSIGMRRYDLVVNVVNQSASGRVSAQIANARYRFLGDIDAHIQLQYSDHHHMAKFPVYSFRKFVSRLGYTANAKPVSGLDLKLSSKELVEGKQLLSGLVDSGRSTICIYTYATGAKLYAESWWEDFYEQLKRHYPEYNILEILPIENVSQIAFKAPAFYSRDLRLIASVIANTGVFIGADSGMMHLASAAGTPTIGLFKSDNLKTYAPYNNNSIGVNTNSMESNQVLGVLDPILARRFRV